jgi:aldose 1-epimerase
MPDLKETTEDTEFVLMHGDLHLRAAPFGATIRGLWQGDGDVIIHAYTGSANNIGSQGDVLMPFPSRIPGGTYTFGGETHQLSTDGGPRSHDMHGFLRSTFWETESITESAVTFAVTVRETDFPGYPFALRVTVTYSLTGDGLRCDFRAENTGARDAPFGAGFHPYFRVGSEIIDDDLLQLPFDRTIRSGVVSGVADTVWDFRAAKPVGGQPCDAVFTGPLRDADGLARVRFTSPDSRRSVTVWMDETFGYLVLYSGDTLPPAYRRRALAIEPWTCAPDAFNYPERGLTVLAPGGVLAGSWGVVLP